MSRGRPHLRLRLGFIIIAVVLSIFGARLVQLQGFDPHSYAAAANQESEVSVDLPAQRGEISDRNGDALADSSDGLMVLADPSLTSDHAAQIARILADKLNVDYFSTLKALSVDGSRFQYIARRIPATVATAAVSKVEKAGYTGLWTERDPVRDYPAGDVAANIVGFLGDDGPLAGLEQDFNNHLSGTDGHATYNIDTMDGAKIPLGNNSRVDPVNGKNLKLTIDRDLQWYSQRALMQAVQQSGAKSGSAVVMDSRTGEVLSLADYPTYDARKPAAYPAKDRGIPSLSNPYEPGSVEKVLTLSSLLNTGRVTTGTKLRVHDQYPSGGAIIHDWFTHGLVKWTLAGVVANSSNIGTVMASNKFKNGELKGYLNKFGLGQPTNVGVESESRGQLPSEWTPAGEDRIDFGQALSVNALQMTAAVNTIANGGVRVDPSLIIGKATNDAGQTVGTDESTSHRVVSAKAARGMAHMMERVVDPDAGTAPAAQVPGYRVAGKTGTAQEVNPKTGHYAKRYTVSFAGFAPTDKPRFTVYVVIHAPKEGSGGGTAGPVFSKIMGFALRRYGVPPTGTKPSKIPTTW